MTKVKPGELVAFVNDRISKKLPISDAIIAANFQVTRQNIQQKRLKLQKAGMWPDYQKKIGHPTIAEMLQKETHITSVGNQNYLTIIQEIQTENENLRSEITRLKKENLDLKISHAVAGVNGVLKITADNFSLDQARLTSHNIYKYNSIFSLPILNINTVYNPAMELS